MRSAATLPAALGLSLLLYLLSTAPALGQMGGDLRAGATHQDWQVLCEDTPVGETCFISQAAADDTGEPVMQIMVGRLEGENVMVIYLPLGIDLRPGMLFQIGDDLRREFPFQTCLPNGCRVIAQVDSEMLAAMRAGATFLVGVRPLESEQVAVIEGSLMGFTAGFREVTQ
ncbi:MAG: Invasion associated locus B family protein [Thioalkalivibrio sp.]|nr:MAG: Invasion associated locus B family protein [Thioalkalivibrio sp.]